MKKVTIEVSAKFGSKFQEHVARDSLFMALKTWRLFVHGNHKKNEIELKINGVPIQHLEFFFWNK